MKTINTLKFAEKVKVADLIRANTEPDGKNYIRYKNGLTDETMAALATETLGRLVTAENVVAIRRGAIGNLHKHGSPESMAKARAARAANLRRDRPSEIDTLRAEIAEQRQAIYALGEMVTNLQRHVMLRQPVATYKGNGARASA